MTDRRQHPRHPASFESAVVAVFLFSALLTAGGMLWVAHRLQQDGFPIGAALFCLWAAIHVAGVVATIARIRR